MSAAVQQLEEPVVRHVPVSRRASETRRRVTVTAAWSFVDGGYCFPQGTSEAVLYTSDIDKLKLRIPDAEALSESHWRTDPAKIESAKALFEAGKASFVEARAAGMESPNLAKIWAQQKHEYEGPKTWQECYVRQHLGHIANDAGYKSVGPIRELVIHDEEIAPPVPQEQQVVTQQMKTMFAEFMRMMMAGNVPPESVTLTAEKKTTPKK